MPKPSAYSRFSEKTKKKIRKRQENNGFSDIDGLAREINQLEPDFQVSRTTSGRISKSMKDDAARAKQAADLAATFLNEVGDKIYDTAAFNQMILDSRFNEMIQWLEITKEDIESLEPSSRIALLIKLTNAQASNAKAHRFVAPERRTVKQESAAQQKQAKTFNEYRQKLADQIARIKDESDN